MFLYRVTKYLRYILFSKHRKGHGIHSPFVFDLISRVFRNKTNPDIVCKIEKVRRKLMSDQRTIVVKDLGSGSEKPDKNIRKVSDIARYSAVPGKYGRFLYNIAAEFGDQAIIELGTSFGMSTMYMAFGCPGATVYTIEGCKAISEIAGQCFYETGLNNIKVFTGSFDEILPDILNLGIKPGLVFIDGNHRKGPLLKYFNLMTEVSDNKTVMIIDDIFNSKEMGEAWSEIKSCEKVSVTIDIFRMGIVFFRKGITPDNYIIRY